MKIEIEWDASNPKQRKVSVDGEDFSDRLTSLNLNWSVDNPCSLEMKAQILDGFRRYLLNEAKTDIRQELIRFTSESKYGSRTEV